MVPESALAEKTPGPPADPTRTNTIRWTVKGGSTPFAYEVFRGESESGPFTKVNEDFISGHLNSRSERVKAYEFVDGAIELDKEYWYYVDALNLMGVRERLTPVRKAPAKVKPSPSAPPR